MPSTLIRVPLILTETEQLLSPQFTNEETGVLGGPLLWVAQLAGVRAEAWTPAADREEGILLWAQGHGESRSTRVGTQVLAAAPLKVVGLEIQSVDWINSQWSLTIQVLLVNSPHLGLPNLGHTVWVFLQFVGEMSFPPWYGPLQFAGVYCHVGTRRGISLASEDRKGSCLCDSCLPVADIVTKDDNDKEMFVQDLVSPPDWFMAGDKENVEDMVVSNETVISPIFHFL